MKQTIVSIVAIVAISVSGFSQQQTYHVKSSDSYQKITLEADKGTGVLVNDIEVKVEWNPDEDFFTMHFTNDNGLNKDKYLYLFPKMEKMSKMKKKVKGLWFDKSLKTQSKENGIAVVYGYCNGSSKEENVQMFDLGKETSFELTFTEADSIQIKPNATNIYNVKLYVYVANNTWQRARHRKVCYLDILDFKIELIAPCTDSAMTAEIAQYTNELQETEVLVTNLRAETQKLSSSNSRSQSEKSTKNKKIINDDFILCDTYTSAISNLNSKIEEYNNEVANYNKRLQTLQRGNRPAPPRCDCDCNTVRNSIETRLGPLFVELSQNQISKEAAKEKLNTIKQSSISCTGSCNGKDCNVICESQCAEAYRTFQDYCSKIERLLN